MLTLCVAQYWFASCFCFKIILPGEENKVPVGIIEVKLEVLPIPQQILSNEVIATQVKFRHL